jgi:hypothetical protein
MLSDKIAIGKVAGSVLLKLHKRSSIIAVEVQHGKNKKERLILVLKVDTGRVKRKPELYRKSALFAECREDKRKPVFNLLTLY